MTEPADYAELVRRLRVPIAGTDANAAADAIEALMARVAELEDERRRAEAVIETYIPLGDLPSALASIRSYIAALEAEARQHALDLQAAEARSSALEALRRAVIDEDDDTQCRIVGHKIIPDHCGKPAHDYCTRCGYTARELELPPAERAEAKETKRE